MVTAARGDAELHGQLDGGETVALLLRECVNAAGEQMERRTVTSLRRNAR